MKPAAIGVCCICKVKAMLVVDHDHKSWFGLVRGLICQPCNGRLGRLEKGKVKDLAANSGAYLPYLAYLADPPLAHRRVSYWWLKYADVWNAEKQRRIDDLHKWLSGAPVLF